MNLYAGIYISFFFTLFSLPHGFGVKKVIIFRRISLLHTEINVVSAPTFIIYALLLLFCKWIRSEATEGKLNNQGA